MLHWPRYASGTTFGAPGLIGQEVDLVPVFPQSVFSKGDRVEIQQKLDLSQEAFALRFGFSPAAVRDWRRQPEQAARVLLMVMDEAPQVVERVLRKVAAAREAYL